MGGFAHVLAPILICAKRMSGYFKIAYGGCRHLFLNKHLFFRAIHVTFKFSLHQHQGWHQALGFFRGRIDGFS